jgi:23S rRNA pseudouridine1911/1915/1917 synthase
MPPGREKLEVVYEDDDIIVVNKPAGLLSVPIRGGSVPSALSILSSRSGNRRRPLVVHRIDRYTSGLLVFAKNAGARHFLVQQFLAHTPVRRYQALIHGTIKPPSGVLTHYLKLGNTGFRQRVVSKQEEGAAEARLKYKTLQVLENGASLVEITLETGLKNQIRAQFAAAGHPVVGDIQYGERGTKKNRPGGIDHQALFASSLSFVHPATGKEVSFTVEPPSDFLDAMEQ